MKSYKLKRKGFLFTLAVITCGLIASCGGEEYESSARTDLQNYPFEEPIEPVEPFEGQVCEERRNNDRIFARFEHVEGLQLYTHCVHFQPVATYTYTEEALAWARRAEVNPVLTWGPCPRHPSALPQINCFTPSGEEQVISPPSVSRRRAGAHCSCGGKPIFSQEDGRELKAGYSGDSPAILTEGFCFPQEGFAFAVGSSDLEDYYNPIGSDGQDKDLPLLIEWLACGRFEINRLSLSSSSGLFQSLRNGEIFYLQWIGRVLD